MYASIEVAKAIDDAIKIENTHSRSISGITMVNTPPIPSPLQTTFPRELQQSCFEAMAQKLLESKVDGLLNEVLDDPVQSAPDLVNEDPTLEDVAEADWSPESTNESLQHMEAELARKNLYIQSFEDRSRVLTADLIELTTWLNRKRKPNGGATPPFPTHDLDDIKDLEAAVYDREAAFDQLREDMKEVQFRHHTMSTCLDGQTQNVGTARAEIADLKNTIKENADTVNDLLENNDAKQKIIDRMNASVKATHERVTHGTTSSVNSLQEQLDETKAKLATSEDAETCLARELEDMKKQLKASKEAQQNSANELEETKQKLVASETVNQGLTNELDETKRKTATLEEAHEETGTDPDQTEAIQNLEDDLQSIKQSYETTLRQNEMTMNARMSPLLDDIDADQEKALINQIETATQYEKELLEARSWNELYIDLGARLTRRVMAIHEQFLEKERDAFPSDLSLLDEAKDIWIWSKDQEPVDTTLGTAEETSDNSEEQCSDWASDSGSESNETPEDELEQFEDELLGEISGENAMLDPELDEELFGKSEIQDPEGLESATDHIDANQGDVSCGSPLLDPELDRELYGECEMEHVADLELAGGLEDETHDHGTPIMNPELNRELFGESEAEDASAPASTTGRDKKIQADKPFADFNADFTFNPLEFKNIFETKVERKHSGIIKIEEVNGLLLEQAAIAPVKTSPPESKGNTKGSTELNAGVDDDRDEEFSIAEIEAEALTIPEPNAPTLWGILDSEPLLVSEDSVEDDEDRGILKVSTQSSSESSADTQPAVEQLAETIIMSENTINDSLPALESGPSNLSGVLQPESEQNAEVVPTSSPTIHDEAQQPLPTPEEIRRAEITENVRKALEERKAKEEEAAAQQAAIGASGGHQRMSRQERRDAERRAKKEKEKGKKGGEK